MSYLFTDNLTKYLESHTMDRHFIYKEMELFAGERDYPIIGPQVGQLLYILTKIAKAKHVFEVGSGFGYSALWFAVAMEENGTVICTEYDEKNINRGKDFLRSIDTLRARIEFRSGNGIDLLNESNDEYDIIFNDANKEDYPKIFEIAKNKLKKGGLLIADNVLWRGQVTDSEPDNKTSGVIQYNKAIFESEDFFSSIIPIRDGVSVSIKLT